ncbi:cyclohexanecarboxylate-CoA ligase [Parafrankia colletiae]|uniref:Cyclohexanecarboxylate-CoA ligase n=1 Tax=Parafrankia colletiae TaxID=573497 RepID=A0A1S1R349_9ACTN|nr:AMP-binding protein [Parafrankia colletiae]MCK9900232.1 AMP-binding protein [Frankia sp. Cpl3]OHV40347.1 cyclohexanecarboxylate-CoA ligase [Parafrankia colletiae]
MTFWGLLDDATRRAPDAVVLADDHGRSLTTAALRDAAGRAAAGLHRRGVGPGDVVCWQLPTTLEAAVVMAACARLGAVQNPVIPVFRHREVGFIVRQVSARLVIVPESWHGFGHGAMARSLGPEVLVLDLDGPPGPALRLPEGDPASLPPAPAPARARADECRWIYYSSGTTADPKGVRHTDESVIASSAGVVDGLGFGAGDVYPIAWPIAHIGGVSMLAAALRTGGTLVLFDVFDPAVTPERMAAHRPTVLGSATPFFHAYLAAQRRHGGDPLFPALRACVGGGAATPEPVNREVAQVLGVSGVVGSWGLTEFPVATSERSTDAEPGTTVGRPAAGVRVRVVDGELRLKGPQCFLGYADAGLDAEAFDADGWLRTGDLGDVDEQGRVRVRGRRKEVVIRNAETISAAEVEGVLARHPAVRDVAVVGVPDERTGERICAVVVVRPGHDVPLAVLVAHCQAEGLARHKCPERLEIVGELPRNPMGKVLRRALEGWLASVSGDRVD